MLVLESDELDSDILYKKLKHTQFPKKCLVTAFRTPLQYTPAIGIIRCLYLEHQQFLLYSIPEICGKKTYYYWGIYFNDAKHLIILNLLA
jgi:hypothetical protein